MHRAQPTASKLCEKRNKDRAYQIHMQKLAKMKSSINTEAPKRMPHLRKNLKKLQIEQENFEKIKYENQLLLNKMTDIMEKKYIDNENESAKYIHSLNRESRKRELMRITKENQAILKRIQRKQPVYNHMDWERDRQRNEQYIQNICEYPYAGATAGGRTSLRMSQYGASQYGAQPNQMQAYGEPNQMQAYDDQQQNDQNYGPNWETIQQQEQQHEMLEDQNVDDLIDEVDKQLEQAGLKDDAAEDYDAELDNGDAAAEEESSSQNNSDATTRVRLTVIAASHLKDNSDTIDPYVKVQLAPADQDSEPYESFKPLETQSQTATSSPSWNETFSLECNMGSDALLFSIYDSATNELIETVTQRLSELRFKDDVVVSLKSGGNLKFMVAAEA